MEFEKLQIGTW